MATLGTYYYDGTSFASATTLCTDSGLTQVAPNGWYSQGGIYRQMAGGILGNPQTCASCGFACNDPALSGEGTGAFGKYKITVDLGSATGAVAVKFFVGVDSAVRCTWTYDGTTASEYSSPNWGYAQGLIGSEVCCGVDNINGSNGVAYNGTEYQLDPTGWVNNGVANWGPYTANDVTLNPAGGYGVTTMIIPKPNAAPSTATFEIDMAPNVSGIIPWTFQVECPTSLSPFTVDDIASLTDCISACQNVNDPVTKYHYPVSGQAGGLVQLHDWVFIDSNGVTEMADGYYRAVVAGINQCMQVENGVVKQLSIC